MCILCAAQPKPFPRWLAARRPKLLNGGAWLSWSASGWRSCGGKRCAAFALLPQSLTHCILAAVCVASVQWRGLAWPDGCCMRRLQEERRARREAKRRWAMQRFYLARWRLETRRYKKKSCCLFRRAVRV